MMVKYEITTDRLKKCLDWKEIVKKSDCKLNPRPNNYTRTEGHHECSQCPGNYWNGGSCNYSTNEEGEHNLLDDLDQINTNFEWLGALLVRHDELKKSKNKEEFDGRKSALTIAVGKVIDNCNSPNEFFSDTCLILHNQPFILNKGFERRLKELSEGLTKYAGKINNLNFDQFTEFEDKFKEVESLQTKRKKNKTKIQKLTKELDKHPAFILFDLGIRSILKNCTKELFEPSSNNPFTGLGREKGKKYWVLLDKKDVNDEDNKGPKEGWPWGTIALYGGGGLLVVIGLWLIYKLSKKAN